MEKHLLGASICAITFGTCPSLCINVSVLQTSGLWLRGSQFGRSQKPRGSGQTGYGAPSGSLTEGWSVPGLSEGLVGRLPGCQPPESSDELQ